MREEKGFFRPEELLASALRDLDEGLNGRHGVHPLAGLAKMY